MSVDVSMLELLGRLSQALRRVRSLAACGANHQLLGYERWVRTLRALPFRNQFGSNFRAEKSLSDPLRNPNEPLNSNLSTCLNFPSPWPRGQFHPVPLVWQRIRGALRSPSQLLGFAAKNEGAEMLVLYSVLQRWVE